jgi:hypothetical protein
LITAGYAELDDTALSDPAIGILLNMFHRNFELVEAVVVTFVTGCGTAAEVASRAAVPGLWPRPAAICARAIAMERASTPDVGGGRCREN